MGMAVIPSPFQEIWFGVIASYGGTVTIDHADIRYGGISYSGNEFERSRPTMERW